MPDLFSVLFIYYACDTASQKSLLSNEVMAQCTSAYEEVKTLFLTQDELELLTSLSYSDRALQMRQGYVRFKEWEAQNPLLVASMKSKVVAYTY